MESTIFIYKEFFAGPNLYQRNAKFYGNKNLNTEEGYMFEFGNNYGFDDALPGNFNIFRQHAQNRIVSAPMAWKYENSGTTDSMGLPCHWKRTLAATGITGFGYTFLQIKTLNDSQNGNLDGRLL